jgi:hypothetical protein
MRVSIRVFGDELQLVRRGDDPGLAGAMPVSPGEAAWAVESQVGDKIGGNPALMSDLASLVRAPRAAGFSLPAATVRVRSAVVDAIRSGRVLAFRTARPTVAERLNKIEPLGWVDEIEELEDVYVLAAEVRQLGAGDVPFMHHRVRILDPDTGEAVSGVLVTDEHGVVRANVPEAKVYRIELLDEDLEAEGPPSEPDEEHALLRCLFVDEHGEPIPDLVVVAHLDEGRSELVTNEDGEIEAPAHLAHYRLEVGDRTFDAHAVLARDTDADEGFYRFVVPSTSTDERATGDEDDRLGRYDDGDEELDVDDDDADADADEHEDGREGLST